MHIRSKYLFEFSFYTYVSKYFPLYHFNIDSIELLDGLKNNLIVNLFDSCERLNLSLFNLLRFELFTHNTLSLLGI